MRSPTAGRRATRAVSSPMRADYNALPARPRLVSMVILVAALVPDAAAAAAPTPASARSPEETFGRLMLAIAAAILAARLLGALVRRLWQPRVMGEVVAGLLLGPTLLGRVWPGAAGYLFPSDIVPLLRAGADIGLAFYMFLVGLELHFTA